MPQPDKEVILKNIKNSWNGIAKAKVKAEDSIKWVFSFTFFIRTFVKTNAFW